MSDKRIDWTAGQQQVAEADRRWLQALGVEESIRLYCSLANFALAQRDETDGWRRIEEQRWQEKLALRKKLLRALGEAR